MKLADVLAEGQVHLTGSADDLRGATAFLLEQLQGEAGFAEEQIAGFAEGLADGSNGTVVRADDDVILAAIEHPHTDGTIAALGVFGEGFSAPGGREGDEAKARILLLLLTNTRVNALRAEAFPRLTRAFRTRNVTRTILRASSPADVLKLDHLVDADLQGALLVADATSPVSYRIYPDTPLLEVLDLVARRGVPSLPVVGSEYQVLGLISRSDALGQMVRRHGTEQGEGDEEPVLARDIMSRSVLCVEEDLALLEAARLMVNKRFESLPVVRDGELVGFVTEETALRMLGSALHE